MQTGVLKLRGGGYLLFEFRFRNYTQLVRGNSVGFLLIYKHLQGQKGDLRKILISICKCDYSLT